MKRVYQQFFGWVLLILGVILILSTFISELLDYQQLTLSQTDGISIFLGLIITYIGYKGVKGKW